MSAAFSLRFTRSTSRWSGKWGSLGRRRLFRQFRCLHAIRVVERSQSTPGFEPNACPLRHWSAEKRILVLQLEAFPDSNTADVESPKKWYYQLASPIQTMLTVRSEGQLVRDKTAGEDLQKLLNGKGYETMWLLVRYTPSAVKFPGGAVFMLSQSAVIVAFDSRRTALHRPGMDGHQQNKRARRFPIF